MKQFLICLYLFFLSQSLGAQVFNQPETYVANVQFTVDTDTTGLIGLGIFNTYTYIPTDIDNDGDLDFIGNKNFMDEIEILYNEQNDFIADSIFVGSSTAFWGGPRSPLIVQDLDNDGNNDIIFEDGLIMFQQNDKSFSSNEDILYSSEISNFFENHLLGSCVVDLNNDGKMDIVSIIWHDYVNGNYLSSLYCFYQDDNSNFHPELIKEGKFVDYNIVQNESKIELIASEFSGPVGNLSTCKFQCFEKDPNTPFQFKYEYDPIDPYALWSSFFDVTDRDMDGKSEIIYSDNTRTFNIWNSESDLISLDNAAREHFFFGQLVDLNNNGFEDILFILNGFGQVNPSLDFYYCLSDSEGNFGEIEHFYTYINFDKIYDLTTMYSRNQVLQVYDENNDGFPDLFFSDFENKEIKIFRNIAEGSTSSNFLKPEINSVNIFPNPFIDHILLNSNKAISEVSIYNLKGELVKHKKFPDEKLNLQELASEVYIITVTLSNSEQVSRFLIKN